MPGLTPRSPVPTDRGVDHLPQRGNLTDLPPPLKRHARAQPADKNPHNLKCGIFLCTQVYGCLNLVNSVRFEFGQDGISNLGTTGGLLCVCGRIWEDILSNSGVLAWTPVGKQMGPRIPVRVTPHSSAHPNNTGGGEGGQSRPNGVFRKTGTTKNGKRDEARREGTCSTCALKGAGETPRV